MQTIRYAILSHAEDSKGLLSSEIELDKTYFGGWRKGNRARGGVGKDPVFGILEQQWKIGVTVDQDV